MIIFKNRVVAARCILPVSQNPEVPATLGLRHRAGIGMTEATDAIVLVVSEETGRMSFVQKGQVWYNLNTEQLREHIIAYLQSLPDEGAGPSTLRKED
jgi:DNA integrity scanning protein DisA with diadenylate cyclase activity